MAFTLRPTHLETATSATDIQKRMRADLKSNLGKKNVKFVAAKNAVIGGKTIQLFIVTDNPTAFETVLKAKQPKAYRAKGACDLEKDKETGATKVIIKASTGQMGADAVGRLIPLAFKGDKSLMVSFPAAEKAKLLAQIQNPPTLNKTGAPDKSGVPDWAKVEYRKDAKKSLIASMTPDGKIGSVYFGKEGRIRMTHSAGPAKEGHGGQTTVQFNINETLAVAEFKKTKRQLIRTLKSEDEFWEHYDQWLIGMLEDVKVDSAPAWAKLVDSPKTAHKLRTGAPPKDVKLVEIFKNINGEVESWHPSRGTATKFVTDKQTISILEAAIKHIDGKKLTDPKQRNIEFYNFVKSRLPKFVPYMRPPEEV